MMEIELRADNKFVAIVAIPPFLEPPQVVAWGERTFLLRGGNAGRLVYNEVSFVWSLTPSPGLPRGE